MGPPTTARRDRARVMPTRAGTCSGGRPPMVADALYCICVQVTIECWTRLPAWMLRPRQSAHLCVLPAPVTSVPAAEHWPSARGWRPPFGRCCILAAGWHCVVKAAMAGVGPEKPVIFSRKQTSTLFCLRPLHPSTLSLSRSNASRIPNPPSQPLQSSVWL